MSVVKKGVAPLGKGNVVILDKAPPYAAANRPEWLTDSQLRILIPKGSRLFVQNKRVGAVDVSYRPVDPQNQATAR